MPPLPRARPAAPLACTPTPCAAPLARPAPRRAAALTGARESESLTARVGDSCSHSRPRWACTMPARRLRAIATALAPAAVVGAGRSDEAEARRVARDASFASITPCAGAPTYTHASRFAPGEMAAAAAHLQTEGFAVIQTALSEGECAVALDLVWRFLEGLGAGIDRHDSRSWGSPAADLVFPDAGVIHPFGATHSEAAWFVRSVPAVKDCFAALWGTTDLCCSFDGLNCTRPCMVQPSWRTRPAWFHTDQRPFPSVRVEENVDASCHTVSATRRTALIESALVLWQQASSGTPSGFDLQYLQGFVNLIQTSEASGGNVVVPASHVSRRARV